MSASVDFAAALAGVLVEMIQYPREDHGPLARGCLGFPSQVPWHGFDARQRMLNFINAALGTG